MKEITSLSYILTFGKYKGRTIQEVSKTDASYIVWAHVNVPWFKLNKELLDKMEELKEDQYIPLSSIEDGYHWYDFPKWGDQF